MSAFFVNPAVIDDTVAVAMAHAAHWDPALELDPSNAATDLGRKLFAMNREAIRQRYPHVCNTQEDVEMAEEAETYEWQQPGREITVGQMIKSASCLHYQCSEGDIDKTPLYEWLAHLIEVASENASQGRKTTKFGLQYWDVPGEEQAQWNRARSREAA